MKNKILIVGGVAHGTYYTHERVPNKLTITKLGTVIDDGEFSYKISDESTEYTLGLYMGWSSTEYIYSTPDAVFNTIIDADQIASRGKPE